MLCCTCSRKQYRFDEAIAMPEGGGLVELASKELSTKILEGEAKLEEGSFEEAEITLREALSINNEEARALLGRMEYQKGNWQGAIQLFEGIHLGGLLARMRFFASEKGQVSKKVKNSKASELSNFLHASSLLIEAIYLKAKSLQKLGALADAALECKCVLDLMEEASPAGMPSTWGETKVAKMVANVSLLYPKLLVQGGLTDEALSAYRQTLLSTWCPNEDTMAALQKEFAILLLYGGVDASSSSPAHVGPGRHDFYVPKNNTEEAILLLLLLLRRSITPEGSFDSSVMDHLCVALSVSSQCEMLAHQYEELMPGTLGRGHRWYNLALCYYGAGENDLALNLLRKTLNPLESPNDLASLLLAAKICAGKSCLATEGVSYAKRALEQTNKEFKYMKSCAFHILGVAFGAKARVASSDSKRTRLCRKALKALQEAACLESHDPKIIFDLGLEYATQCQTSRALDCAKRFLGISTGAWIEGWRFSALLLTAQDRHSEAEVVLEAGLDASSPWQQGPLLRTRAKVEMAKGQSLRAIRTYQKLLTLIQAGHQRFSFEAGNWQRNMVGGRVEELEVWQDLASVYTELKQWSDAKVCLEKAQALNSYSPTTWHAAGRFHEARGQLEEALASYKNALAIDNAHVDSKVRLGALLCRTGGKQSLPVARSYLAEALQIEPVHEEAWLQMGLLHKAEGHAQEAVDCFQAAVRLEQSLPVESFSSISPALLW